MAWELLWRHAHGLRGPCVFAPLAGQLLLGATKGWGGRQQGWGPTRQQALADRIQIVIVRVGVKPQAGHAGPQLLSASRLLGVVDGSEDKKKNSGLPAANALRTITTTRPVETLPHVRAPLGFLSIDGVRTDPLTLPSSTTGQKKFPSVTSTSL